MILIKEKLVEIIVCFALKEEAKKKEKTNKLQDSVYVKIVFMIMNRIKHVKDLINIFA